MKLILNEDQYNHVVKEESICSKNQFVKEI